MKEEPIEEDSLSLFVGMETGTSEELILGVSEFTQHITESVLSTMNIVMMNQVIPEEPQSILPDINGVYVKEEFCLRESQNEQLIDEAADDEPGVRNAFSRLSSIDKSATQLKNTNYIIIDEGNSSDSSTVINEEVCLREPDNKQCLVESKQESSTDDASQALYLPPEQKSIQRNFKKYLCDICNKAFHKARSLTSHKLTHKVTTKCECVVCNMFNAESRNSLQQKFSHSDVEVKKQHQTHKKAFTQRATLLERKSSHSDNKLYERDVCDKDDSQSSDFSVQQNKHGTGKKYECSVCNKGFTSSRSLSRHKVVHSSIRKYQCDVCNKTFKLLYSLSVHKFTHNDIKKYKCNVCNKGFTSPRNLATHKLIHNDIKKYTCSVCNKAFAQACTLLKHKVTHTGIKKYHCNVCNKFFSLASNLSVHKLIHSDVKKYICGVCNKAFAQLTGLLKHKVLHSGIKKYKCDVCNKSFSVSGKLSRHKLIHTGKKKHECNICNKTFITADSLSAHKLIHTSIKKYRCDVCNKAFTVPRYLTKHMVVHSRTKNS